MRILVVDDHPMVMQGIAASLKRHGHEVSTARELGWRAQTRMRELVRMLFEAERARMARAVKASQVS